MPAAPKTLEELAALAGIGVDDLREFKESDFDDLTKELNVAVTARVKLRGLFRKLLASQQQAHPSDASAHGVWLRGGVCVSVQQQHPTTQRLVPHRATAAQIRYL